MSLQIDYPKDWDFPVAVLAVLQRMFRDYHKLVLRQEFTEGQSNTHVYLVEPYRAEGSSELPAVVKIGPADLIYDEWTRSQTYVLDQLPGFVAAIQDKVFGEPADELEYIPESALSTGGYAGLRYALVGDGLFHTESLRTYCNHAAAVDIWQVLENRLFKQLARVWRANPQRATRRVHASYDRVLPINLLVQPLTPDEQLPHAPAIVLSAEQLQNTTIDFQAAPPGALIRLEEFRVTEIDRMEQSVTLNLPQVGETREASFRVRVQGSTDLSVYRIGAVAPPLVGRVATTRQELLTSAAHKAVDKAVDLTAATLTLPGNSNIQLPNPLQRWPALLQQALPMKIGTVHGDLNMGNVLVDTQARTTQIIDCAHARRDHALYDLLRLESEALLHPLAAALFRTGQPPTLIVDFYHWLDGVTHTEPHGSGQFAVPQKLQQDLPELVTPFLLLTLIRNAARDYLAARDDWREYYSGLALCLLGTLKFASLDKAPAGQQPKAIAFWGAATMVGLLDGVKSQQAANWQWIDLTATHQPKEQPAMGDTKTETKTDNRSGGVYLEGNQSVKIKGDVISGGTVNKATFHGPVTGPVHTGSGDIHVGTIQNQSGASLESLFADLRSSVTNAPDDVRTKAVQRVDRLDEAIQELDLGMMESTLQWFQRQLPILEDKVVVILVHPTVAQKYTVAGEPKQSEYRRRFGALSVRA